MKKSGSKFLNRAFILSDAEYMDIKDLISRTP